MSFATFVIIVFIILTSLYIMFSFYLDFLVLPIFSFMFFYFEVVQGSRDVAAVVACLAALVLTFIYVYFNFFKRPTKWLVVLPINLIMSVIIIMGMALYHLYQPDIANLYELNLSQAFAPLGVRVFSIVLVVGCFITKTLFLFRQKVLAARQAKYEALVEELEEEKQQKAAQEK